MTIPARLWLDAMGGEYLQDFIAAGGGAVRFVVADAPELGQVTQGLRDRATEVGLQVVRLDAAQVKLHMLQSVVFAVAAALPWDRLIQARLESLMVEAGYRWPAAGKPMTLAELAEANEVAAHLLRRDLSQSLTRAVWHDGRLTQDFRAAMIVLLEARLGIDDTGMTEAMMGWLTGAPGRAAQLRQAGIGRRIGRQNARAVLMSLCHWVRVCGGVGMLLLLDIRQLHLERRAVVEGLVYTPAAVMDCYEVLRQLIDDAEHFPGLFVATLADQAFLSDDPRRSLGQYTALQMRVWDDVRPQGGDNPLAPLVRLAG